MYPVDNINFILALGTIVLQITGLGYFAIYFLRKRFPDLEDIARPLKEWGLWKGFVITIIGTVITLFYSEILGFIPCGWCWIQRVFLYPQVILFGMALRKKDRFIADYSIGLSIAGMLAALYQHYIQMGGSSILPCPASGVGDCAQRLIFEFGYITFPLMSATLFAFLIIVMMFVRSKNY
jgi:disulfide bond formation protein DsbB